MSVLSRWDGKFVPCFFFQIFSPIVRSHVWKMFVLSYSSHSDDILWYVLSKDSQKSILQQHLDGKRIFTFLIDLYLKIKTDFYFNRKHNFSRLGIYSILTNKNTLSWLWKVFLCKHWQSYLKQSGNKSQLL